MKITTDIGNSPDSWEEALEDLTSRNQKAFRLRKIPRLYSADVKYRRESGDGPESWQEAVELLENKAGDCEDLSAYRAAELRELDGEDARAIIQHIKGGKYHAVVRREDGRIEDPSRYLIIKEKKKGSKKGRKRGRSAREAGRRAWRGTKRAGRKLRSWVSGPVESIGGREEIGFVVEKLPNGQHLGFLNIPGMLMNTSTGSKTGMPFQIPGTPQPSPQAALMAAMANAMKAQQAAVPLAASPFMTPKLPGMGVNPFVQNPLLAAQMSPNMLTSGTAGNLMGQLMGQTGQAANPMAGLTGATPYGAAAGMALQLLQDPAFQRGIKSGARAVGKGIKSGWKKVKSWF